MAIKDMKTINLLNYNENVVTVSTRHDSYTIEPAIDSETPTVFPLTIDEIVYINGNSVAFKNGILRFPEDIEEEVYETLLNIHNWRELFTIKEVEDIILHPTVDGLKRLVGIKDSGIFDMVRGVFTRLKNTTDSDISLRVQDIIKARSDELRRGIRNTGIVIKAKDATVSVASGEVDALKKQNDELRAQMENMQKMMEQMMTMQGNSDMAKDNNTDETENAQPKKAGRPKKTQ